MSPRPADPPIPGRPLTVVVVDDDPIVLRTLVRMLRGCRCEAFAEARSALARLRSGPPPDAIVLDLLEPRLADGATLVVDNASRSDTAWWIARLGTRPGWTLGTGPDRRTAVATFRVG